MALNILIVDDNAAVRSGVKLLIAKWRADCLLREAANGEEAVHLAASLRPDVILLDMSMPAISGVEAARRIAELGLGSCVVLLSAQEPSVMATLITRVGAQGYVDKSSVTRDLIPTIEHVLAERNSANSSGENTGDLRKSVAAHS